MPNDSLLSTGIMKNDNTFLQLRLKLRAAIERVEKLYDENQVMKRRLLKYEKRNMTHYNNKKGLNESTGV